MKALFLSALLTFWAFAPMAAEKSSLTGKWKIHQSVAGNDSDGECELSQAGDDISGNCKTAEGKDAKTTGKVEGTKVAWSFASEYNGTPLTIKYTGTVDTEGKIAGNVHVDPFGVDGDFTAIRAK